MLPPNKAHVYEADRVANSICRRRLLNASLAMAAAWLTYVNPFTLRVRTEASWIWLALVIAATLAAAGYALWSVTYGDRRTWMRAFDAATRHSSKVARTQS